jgi:antitoxin component of MazEF toxin-antitoxin module
MGESRKITVEVPADLLKRAQAASGDSLTATVRAGLRLVAAGKAYKSLRGRRGKVRFSRSPAELREDRA